MGVEVLLATHRIPREGGRSDAPASVPVMIIDVQRPLFYEKFLGFVRYGLVASVLGTIAALTFFPFSFLSLVSVLVYTSTSPSFALALSGSSAR